MADYIITPNAEKDIDEILLFIAADNMEASIAFGDRLSDLFEKLAQNPKIGRERPELKPEIRCFPEGIYLIFYREWAGLAAIRESPARRKGFR